MIILLHRQRIPKYNITKISDYKKIVEANQNNFRFMMAWRTALFFITSSVGSDLIDSAVELESSAEIENYEKRTTNKDFELIKHVGVKSEKINVDATATVMVHEDAALDEKPKLKVKLTIYDSDKSLLSAMDWNVKNHN